MDAYKVLKELRDKKVLEENKKIGGKDTKLVKKSGIRESLKRKGIKKLQEQERGEYVWVDWGGKSIYFSSPKKAGFYVGHEVRKRIFDFVDNWNIDTNWGEGGEDMNLGLFIEMNGSLQITVYIGDEEGNFIRDLDDNERIEFETGVLRGSDVM